MKKAACSDAAGVKHSEGADTETIAPGSICNPSDYLRVRPPYRRFEAERQRANHEELTQLERYLAALSLYRYRLDNPGARHA